LPHAIAITPDGKTVYVVNTGTLPSAPGDTVTPIRTATNTALPAITVGTFPLDIAITPGGQTAYVTVDGLHPTSDPGTVVPIRTATNTAGQPIAAGKGPSCIVITPSLSAHARGTMSCAP
ncbi:MAG TPA: hypothetical protein VH641_02035, partial [Streptosporangiaceae bacterium]